MKILANFHKSFNHNQPKVFVQSQWQSGNKSLKFLIFRWILAAYFIATVAFSWQRALSRNAFGTWWIYMTDWGILLCMISTTYGAVLTTRHHQDSIKMNSQSSEYKIYWFLSNVGTVLAFVISTFYYGMLYGGKEVVSIKWLECVMLIVFISARQRDWPHVIHGLLVHAGNSLAMFIQLLVVKHSMNVWHFIYPMITLIVYFSFTIIFYLFGGTNFDGDNFIYPVLKWEQETLEASAVAIGLVILSAILHVFVCFIQRQREKLFKKCFDEHLLADSD